MGTLLVNRVGAVGPAVAFGRPAVARFGRRVETMDEVFQREVPYPNRVLSLRQPGQLMRAAHEYQSFLRAAPEVRRARQLALGDLHGSWEKLLETLAMAGMVTMRPDVARQFYDLSRQYQRLIDTDVRFSKPETVAEAARLSDQFGNLLAHVRWTGGPARQMTLMGDVVCDRGQSDLLTLSLIDRVFREARRHGNREPIRILLSNHDHKALKLFYDHYQLGISPHPKFEDPRAWDVLKAGWYRTFKVVSSRPNLMARMTALYREHFLRQQALIYDPHKCLLMTHAPVNAEVFETFAQALGVPVSVRHPRHMKRLASQLNQAVQAQVLAPSVGQGVAPEDHAQRLEAQHLYGYLYACKEPLATGQWPLPRSVVRTYVHGHTSTHDAPPRGKFDALLTRGVFKPLPLDPVLPDVATLPERGILGLRTQPGQCPTRIGLNNHARFDQPFQRPNTDLRHVVNKVLILA